MQKDSDDRMEAFWKCYLQTLPIQTRPEKPYEAEAFGDNPELANKLATLIVQGIKTATCSALWEYELSGDAIPQVGEKYILLDGQKNPVCIIETTEVTTKIFKEVDAAFACEEAAGDRSLEYWREAHWRFFSRSLPKIAKAPTQDMPLVCERFKVIYLV